MNKCFKVSFKSGDVRFYSLGKTYYYLIGEHTIPIVIVDILTLWTLLSRQGYSDDVFKIEPVYC